MNKAYLKYVLGLLLFGLNGIVASRIHMPSYGIVFFRTLIGSLFLLCVHGLTGGRLRLVKQRRGHLVCLCVSGVAMGLSWMFLYEAYQRSGVGLASLTYYTGPVIVVALSPVLFREKLTGPMGVCFALVLAGMVLTNLRQFGVGGDPIGLFCGLMSAVMYAFMVIFNKKAASITGLKNSALQLSVSFLTVLIYVCVRQGVSLPETVGEWLWLFVLGLVNTGVGCYLYFSSIGSLPVQHVSVLGYIEPLSALVFSALLLREGLGARELFGALLILGGAIGLCVMQSRPTGTDMDNTAEDSFQRRKDTIQPRR